MNLSLLHDTETKQLIDLKCQNDNTSTGTATTNTSSSAATVEPLRTALSSNMVEYENIKPQWHNDISAHVLHFNYNRVKEKSVKNLKLVSVKRPLSSESTVDGIHAHTIFQFGRERLRTTFILDFIFPLSPVQAFAIAISSIECKL